MAPIRVTLDLVLHLMLTSLGIITISFREQDPHTENSHEAMGEGGIVRWRWVWGERWRGERVSEKEEGDVGWLEI